jgi:hypothetical protein
VSQLKQALQHTRTGSVDAEAVMAALEENGFHATDAPGALCGCYQLLLSSQGCSLKVAHLSRVYKDHNSIEENFYPTDAPGVLCRAGPSGLPGSKAAGG